MSKLIIPKVLLKILKRGNGFKLKISFMNIGRPSGRPFFMGAGDRVGSGRDRVGLGSAPSYRRSTIRVTYSNNT